MYLRLVIAYDGTDFSGFQKQPGKRTVQGELECLLNQLLGPGKVVGASRTDAGVHALGQVVVWTGSVPIPEERLAIVLNRRLPSDVIVHEVRWVPTTFRPVRDAQAKYYSYYLWIANARPWPGRGRYVTVAEERLSWAILTEAAGIIRGRHDFMAFRSEGSSAKTTTRHVFQSRWVMEEKGRIWRYDIGADGFLYHMVRRLVGTMILCAKTRDLSLLYEGFNNPQGEKMGFVAPAKGLTLKRIDYDEKCWE